MCCDSGLVVAGRSACCRRAAKLEGDTPPALRLATTAPRRIQAAWLLCNAASAALCVVVGGTVGWAQLELCCVALLWVALTSAVLEFCMACVVSSATEAHLAALHTTVRPVSCAAC